MGDISKTFERIIYKIFSDCFYNDILRKIFKNVHEILFSWSTRIENRLEMKILSKTLCLGVREILLLVLGFSKIEIWFERDPENVRVQSLDHSRDDLIRDIVLHR